MITHYSKHLLTTLLFSGILLISCCARASDDGAPSNLSYCPPIKTLVKDTVKMTWSTPDGWQSYDQSFVDKVTRFSGAQWRGTNVGQMFCVYRGPSEISFPVLLAFKILTLAPTDGQWTENLGGYQNCESSDPKECPFVIRVQGPSEDIYEKAKQLKRTTPIPQRLGF